MAILERTKVRETRPDAPSKRKRCFAHAKTSRYALEISVSDLLIRNLVFTNNFLPKTDTMFLNARQKAPIFIPVDKEKHRWMPARRSIELHVTTRVLNKTPSTSISVQKG